VDLWVYRGPSALAPSYTGRRRARAHARATRPSVAGASRRRPRTRLPPRYGLKGRREEADTFSWSRRRVRTPSHPATRGPARSGREQSAVVHLNALRPCLHPVQAPKLDRGDLPRSIPATSSPNFGFPRRPVRPGTTLRLPCSFQGDFRNPGTPA
jgi:hypothetical protein